MFSFIVQIFAAKLKNNIYKMTFVAAWFEAAPDGVTRQVLGINDQFPSPTIRVSKGDRIQIKLINKKIPKGETDIHWHGIFQKGSLLSDGVGGISQCNPLYGESYLYDFETKDQAGTFWYHSHAGLEYVDGLRGALIIDDPDDPYIRPFNTYISKEAKMLYGNRDDKVEKDLFYVDHSDCDGEIDSVIQLTDWHHELAQVLFEIIQTPNSGVDEPSPQSALINGVGCYTCIPPKGEPLYKTKIIAGKAKKFRIINISAMAVFHFAIDNHELCIVEADGITLDGSSCVEILRINVGQRYSVIVRANQPAENYWIRAEMDETIVHSPPTNWQPEVYGVLEYTDDEGHIINKNAPAEEKYIDMDPLFYDSKTEGMEYIDMTVPLVPLKHPSPPEKADKTFIFDVRGVSNNDGVPFLTFNNIVQSHDMSTTLLGKILNGEDYKTPVEENGVKVGYNPAVFKYGEVIDIIINNYDFMEHPMHSHGHVFYVCYAGAFNSTEYTYGKNPFGCKKDVPVRDVASVNGFSVLVLRLRADNPGVWPFHCHIDWHLAQGLMLNLVESVKGIKELYGEYVDDVIECPTYDHMSMSHP